MKIIIKNIINLLNRVLTLVNVENTIVFLRDFEQKF